MRKITSKQYAEGLYEAIQDKKGEELKLVFNNFLKLVWKNKDWKNLNKILTSFEKVYNEKEGLLEAEVISSRELLSSIKNQIKKWLEEYSKKSIDLKTDIDESLLGGVIIKYEDTVLDGSLKSQLRNLQIKLNK